MIGPALQRNKDEKDNLERRIVKGHDGAVNAHYVKKRSLWRIPSLPRLIIMKLCREIKTTYTAKAPHIGEGRARTCDVGWGARPVGSL